jgi:hypothetical protein
MTTLSCHNNINVIMLTFPVTMITMSCYPDKVIMFQCYHAMVIILSWKLIILSCDNVIMVFIPCYHFSPMKTSHTGVTDTNTGHNIYSVNHCCGSETTGIFYGSGSDFSKSIGSGSYFKKFRIQFRILPLIFTLLPEL